MSAKITTTEQKFKTDLLLLSGLISNNLKRKDRQWLGNDGEFASQWNQYGQIRQALIQLDPKLFGELRDIPLPQPDKSNSFFGDDGMYFGHHLEPLNNEVNRAIQYFQVYEESKNSDPNPINPQATLELLFHNFHKVARQLEIRHDRRSIIVIQDEYDVQDLLRALLSIFFKDIRTEEWTPTYAGGSSRMDFLLKPEQIIVETKMTRKGLNARTLGEQLIVDIEKYQNHPDCKKIFCFVYDPERHITNPRGIESDLSKLRGNVNVKVSIEPKD